jgi:hypothetical protein
MAMPTTGPRFRQDPWRTVVQQFIDGTISYRARFNEPRPGRATVDPLARSALPVLVIIGRNETLHDGPTMAARFTDQLPAAHVELLDEANQLVFIDRALLVNDLLSQFLGSTPDARPPDTAFPEQPRAQRRRSPRLVSRYGARPRARAARRPRRNRRPLGSGFRRRMTRSTRTRDEWSPTPARNRSLFEAEPAIVDGRARDLWLLLTTPRPLLRSS